MPYKPPTIGPKEIVTEGFDLSFKKTRHILNYINQLLKDYPNNPSGALKEIPLNLKGNERYLADFILGNYYSPMFKELKEDEMVEFLATIADEIDLGTDRIDTVLGYMVEDIIIKMRGQPVTKVIRTILSTNFSEKEKDYLLFAFGILSRN